MSRRGRPFIATVAMAAVAAALTLSARPAEGADTRPTSGPKPVPSAGADEGTNVMTVPPAASAALVKIQKRIADYVTTHRTPYTFGNYVNPTTGKIVLDTDAPASLVATLVDLPDASAEQRQAASQTQVHRKTMRNVSGRWADTSPFSGGASIQPLGGGVICSSGYAVRDSAGTTYMVTAGHCFDYGTTVASEGGVTVFGTVSHVYRSMLAGGTGKDMELIGGQDYDGRIYTGPNFSSTSAPVFGAGPAVVGFDNYCYSGRSGGEHCGLTVLSVDGQVCVQYRCTSPTITFTGGVLLQPTDSGAPFYCYSTTDTDPSGQCVSSAPKGPAVVKIRGHVVAATTDGTTGYVEPWAVVASTLNVSIVTYP
jgi:hypothetical protein